MTITPLARRLWEAYTEGVPYYDERYRPRLWQSLTTWEQMRWQRVADAALCGVKTALEGVRATA